MHLHSNRHAIVSSMYAQAARLLRAGDPLPVDFEMNLISAGVNVEALREQIDFEQRQLGFQWELNGSLARESSGN